MTRRKGRALMCLAVCALLPTGAGPTRGQSIAGDRSPVAPSACLSATAKAGAEDMATDGDGVSPSRRARLARGVSVTDLFDPGAEPGIKDMFRHLRRVGVRHVRIPVSPEVFAPEPPVWQAALLQRLDQVVCAAIAADLGVVIDLHPFGPLEPTGGSVAAITARLAEVWRKLANRYGAASPDYVFFEILNEPKLGKQWEASQESLLRVIRSVAPHNTVIATASPWSTAAALAAMTPLADRNVIYTFHFYTPMIFTHQSAAWALPSYASVHGLEFPAEPGNVASVARTAAPVLLPALAVYAAAFHDITLMTAELDMAAAWARRHGTVVVVTEFGVYGRAAPRASRAAWLNAVRSRLEDRHIGWTLWEYKGGFGIDGDLWQGCSAPDSGAKALDLCGS